MAKFTFLEIHLDDASFDAKAPFSGIGGDGDIDVDEGLAADEEESEEAAGGGRSPLKPLLVLVVLVVLALAIKFLLGGEKDADLSAEEY